MMLVMVRLQSASLWIHNSKWANEHLIFSGSQRTYNTIPCAWVCVCLYQKSGFVRWWEGWGIHRKVSSEIEASVSFASQRCPEILQTVSAHGQSTDPLPRPVLSNTGLLSSKLVKIIQVGSLVPQLHMPYFFKGSADIYA